MAEARMHELKDFGERLSHYENDEMLIDEVDEGFCNMMGYTQSELMIRSCGKVGDLLILKVKVMAVKR